MSRYTYSKEFKWINQSMSKEILKINKKNLYDNLVPTEREKDTGTPDEPFIILTLEERIYLAQLVFKDHQNS